MDVFGYRASAMSYRKFPTPDSQIPITKTSVLCTLHFVLTYVLCSMLFVLLTPRRMIARCLDFIADGIVTKQRIQSKAVVFDAA